MGSGVLLLALPSALVLSLLVLHSLNALPRGRAVVFWISVGAYGIARGAGVRWIVEEGLGSTIPYTIRQPLVSIVGVSLQEVAGWAIVVYLGWWIGWRVASNRFRPEGSARDPVREKSRAGTRVAARAEDRASDGREAPPLFPQVAIACLFIGAASWAVESAAVASGWWHWNVASPPGILGRVPFIGIVDWFFVGIDFLLPFTALTAPDARGRPLRFLTLLVFPVHFAAHGFVDRIGGTIPIPFVHLAHWTGLAGILWLASRARMTDAPFSFAAEWSIEGHRFRQRQAAAVPENKGRGGRTTRSGFIMGALPAAAAGIVLLDLAAVDLFVAGDPSLLASLLPFAALSASALRSAAGYLIGAGGVVSALWAPSLAMAAVPSAAVEALFRLRRASWWWSAATLVLIIAFAWAVHSASAGRDSDLARRLDEALAARDSKDTGRAAELLRGMAGDFPESHVPPFLLGEILYKMGDLDGAKSRFEEALFIKPAQIAAWRHLAVIELRSGRAGAAARAAAEGLAYSPGDSEAGYLLERASRLSSNSPRAFRTPSTPERTRAIASLAYEVGDMESASALLEGALEMWPEERWFYATRIRLALAAGDGSSARRVAADYLARHPGDPEALDLARQSGLP